MKMPEQIKKGLECCAQTDCGRDECVYHSLGSGPKCIPAMAADALAYIHQLEAKLAEYEKPLVPLTFEEAYGADYCYIEFSAQEIPRPYVVMIGSMTAKGENKKIVRIYEFGEDAERCLKLRGEDYGKTWRCWPRKPTDDERKAAKWDAKRD